MHLTPRQHGGGGFTNIISFILPQYSEVQKSIPFNEQVNRLKELK